MPELITVASYLNVADAHLARCKLENAGIPCFLANEHLVGMQWLYAQATGGVELKVLEADVPAARELLAEEPPPVWEDTPDDAPEDVPAPAESACPSCGGTNRRYWNPGRAFLILAWLTGLPLPVSRGRYRCKQCGHVWK